MTGGKRRTTQNVFRLSGDASSLFRLIPCECMGQSVNRFDVNGKISHGILQFQDWDDEWEAAPAAIRIIAKMPFAWQGTPRRMA